MTEEIFKLRTTPQQAISPSGKLEYYPLLDRPIYGPGGVIWGYEDDMTRPAYWDISKYDYGNGKRTVIYLTPPGEINRFYKDAVESAPELQKYLQKKNGKNSANVGLILVFSLLAFLIFYKK